MLSSSGFQVTVFRDKTSATSALTHPSDICDDRPNDRQFATNYQEVHSSRLHLTFPEIPVALVELDLTVCFRDVTVSAKSTDSVSRFSRKAVFKSAEIEVRARSLILARRYVKIPCVPSIKGPLCDDSIRLVLHQDAQGRDDQLAHQKYWLSSRLVLVSTSNPNCSPFSVPSVLLTPQRFTIGPSSCPMPRKVSLEEVSVSDDKGDICKAWR